MDKIGISKGLINKIGVVKCNILIIVLSFTVPIFSFGQNCNCEKNLEYLIKKIKSNYAGFEEKTTGLSKNNYIKVKNTLLKKSKGKTGIGCYYILNEFVSFFRDVHLGVQINLNNRDTATIEKFYASSPYYMLDTSEAALRKYNFKDKIEGIWELIFDGGAYKIVILKTGKEKYTGVLLRAENIFWKPLQIKLTARKTGKDKYSIRFFRRDHSPLDETVQITNLGILMINGSPWKKTFPGSVSHPGPTEVRSGFSFSKLSEKTSLITLPSFRIENKKLIDSLIDINDSIIRKSKYLIVDIRNNSGGGITSYDPLYKFFYTNPILAERTVYKSSPDNIEYYKKRVIDPSVSDFVKEDLRILIKKLEESSGRLVIHGQAFTYVPDTILNYPKKIAIVINNKSLSAAEIFLLTFRQSKKTMVFGQNSGGAVDYGNALLGQPLLCPNFTYSYALAKREGAIKSPIDGIGIKPDIYLKSDESNWIKAIQNYLEK